jgi:hypothetical protein
MQNSGAKVSFGSIAARIGPSRPVHGMRVQVRGWISVEPIEDEADNLLSNYPGFTRFLWLEVGNWCAFGLRRE